MFEFFAVDALIESETAKVGLVNPIAVAVNTTGEFGAMNIFGEALNVRPAPGLTVMLVVALA